MRVIVHIGSTKSGSSALQAALYSRRAVLREQGILYSATGVVASAHHLLAASLHPGAWKMHPELPDDRLAYFQTCAEAILAEAEAAAAHTVILSSEYFWGSMPLATYRRLAAGFPAASFEIVAFVRRQDEWAMSSYLQAVKSGERRAFAQYVDAVLDRPQSGLHYFKVINRWVEMLGAARTRVIRYSDARENVLAAFCQAVGIDIETDMPPATINPSPNSEGMAELLRVNRSDLPPEEKAAARAEVMRKHRATGPTTPAMTDAERARVYAISGLSDGLIERTFLAGGETLFPRQTVADEP